MNRKIIADLKGKYFDDANKVIHLKKGEILMKQNEGNKRLFLVLEGLVAGSWNDGDGEKIEVFRSDTDMLVGFHGFFSRTFSAYSEVIALKDTKLAYISYDEDERTKTNEFLEDFTPVLIGELFERQIFAKKLMLEKESVLIKNHHKEKLATLGQMAAGIAHELNNAIGIINGNAEWLAKEIFWYIKKIESSKVFINFEKGYEKGQYLSSIEVRKKRQELQKKLNLSITSAKKLAKLGYDGKDKNKLKAEAKIDELAENMYYFWEMGVAIHDMLLASKHATNVISSVQTLGMPEREQMEVDINKTIKEALTLVQKQAQGIKIIFDSEALPTIQSNDSEMIQVWINLIKNACEILKNDKTSDPQITIQSKIKRKTIWVSITDNGPGIKENLIEKIFQPDFTTKKGGLSFGLGLGLPVVQKHVHQYKGTINVDSKPGKTTFTIKLPTE